MTGEKRTETRMRCYNTLCIPYISLHPSLHACIVYAFFCSLCAAYKCSNELHVHVYFTNFMMCDKFSHDLFQVSSTFLMGWGCNPCVKPWRMKGLAVLVATTCTSVCIGRSSWCNTHLQEGTERCNRHIHLYIYMYVHEPLFLLLALASFTSLFASAVASADTETEREQEACPLASVVFRSAVVVI